MTRLNKVALIGALAACMHLAGCYTCRYPATLPSTGEMQGSWVGTSRESARLVRMDVDSNGSIEITRDGKHWRSTKLLSEHPIAFTREDYDLVAADGSAGMIRFYRRLNSLDVEFITNESRERFLFIKHSAATELVNN